MLFFLFRLHFVYTNYHCIDSTLITSFRVHMVFLQVDTSKLRIVFSYDKKMKSPLLGLCANDTFCLVSRGGACCCRQFLRNVSDYCLAGGIYEVGMQSYLLVPAVCTFNLPYF